MADVNPLEEKLAEVIGLAEAAQKAVEKVASLPESDAQADLLERLGQESEETAKRAREVAGEREGKKTAILDKAQETKNEGVEMMESYLGGGDADGLDGFEFLTMCEAGEVGHWNVLEQMGSGNSQVQQLVAWALPIQQGHYETVLRDTRQLAGSEDPDEASS